jgi:hypothetical protein
MFHTARTLTWSGIWCCALGICRSRCLCGNTPSLQHRQWRGSSGGGGNDVGGGDGLVHLPVGKNYSEGVEEDTSAVVVD